MNGAFAQRAQAVSLGKTEKLSPMPTVIQDRTPELLLFEPDEKMPNNRLPVLVYRQTAQGSELEDLFRGTFAANSWGGLWTGAIFGYDHFHSNAHEVVGVASGEAILGLGGASGRRLEVAEGDVVILPAGTGHRRVRGSGDFLVIGAFPVGQEIHDIYTDLTACEDYLSRVAAVPLPVADPVYGTRGPLRSHWSAQE